MDIKDVKLFDLFQHMLEKFGELSVTIIVRRKDDVWCEGHC